MLKPYMIFSQSAGSGECAGLALAHSHQEARKIGWQYFEREITYEYTDIGANLMRNHPWLMKEADPQKLAGDIPHAFYPRYCSHCEHWGHSEIGEDGLCDPCRKEISQFPAQA